MKSFILLVCCFFSCATLSAQKKTIDVVGMHQLINQSKAENKLQVKAKNSQATVTANEKLNLTQLEKLKEKYRELQQRYNTLGTAINIAQIGIYATPMIDHIVSNQVQIMKLVEKNPALLLLGYRTEIEFTMKAKSLLGYVTGLVLSIGDFNQMKAADRKMLFDYVLSELSILQEISGNLVNNLQYANLSSLLRAANPFQDFIDADKEIAKDILQNAKYLKQ